MYAPELSSKLKCSDAWIRKFVFRQKELCWVMRKPTKAAQKLPLNADEQILMAFFRQALTCRDAAIRHPCFKVNMDQTQVTLLMGAGLTFERIGAKQVPAVGLEDKRAFTLVVAVSASGDLLPFQSIYQGKTALSVPSKNSLGHAEAIAKGFYFDPSGTDTYWANIETMKRWTELILIPYWMEKKAELGIAQQECILQLDAWKVHTTVFKEWITSTYPWITLDFVPGGCTGVAQPCDVGIQRPLKLSIRRCQQDDLVEEVKHKLDHNGNESVVVLDKTIGTLRNRSVKWLLDAHNEVNKSDMVKKAS
jgi:hypothetical protein